MRSVAEPVKNGSRPGPGAEERRAQIVTRASELFDEAGYDSTSMGDIADAVGLAKPSLYHYFPSKGSILAAIHEQFIPLLLERQRVRMSDMDASSSDQLFEVMFDIVDLVRTHRGHVRAFFEHNRQLPGVSRLKACTARVAYFESVRRLFEIGQERGDFEGDPNMSAMAMFGMCNWVYQWYDPSGNLSTAEIATYFHNVLCNGLHPR